LIKGFLDERLRDDLHQKLTIINSSSVGAEPGVMGQLGLAKDFLDKELELRKAVYSIETGAKRTSYTCLSLPAPIMI
jgi:hypothetical protein